MCIFFKVITTRVSSAESENIPKAEFKNYIENGDFDWVGYGKPGITLAKIRYDDKMNELLNNLHM